MPKYPEITQFSHRPPFQRSIQHIMLCNLSPQPAGAWDVRVVSSPGPRGMRGAQHRYFPLFLDTSHFSSISCIRGHSDCSTSHGRHTQLHAIPSLQCQLGG